MALWRAKNRVHAALLIMGALVSLVYFTQQGLLWSFAWRFVVLFQLHQMLMTLSHRLLFHRTRGVVWKSPALVFVLRNWTLFFWPEGFECVRAAHDTTQRSQKCDRECLSETVLWFSPQYMTIDRRAFVTRGYMARHLALQVALYAGALFAWPQGEGGQLWLLTTLFIAPVGIRMLFYRGHSALHRPQASLFRTKFQNHTADAYEAQAYNRGMVGPSFLTKYVLGLVMLGDHLHNNHHHDPNAMDQAYTNDEIDGAYLGMRLLARLGLLKLKETA